MLQANNHRPICRARLTRRLVCWLALAGICVNGFAAEKGLRETRPAREMHVGPIYDSHRRPLDKARQAEMFGPLLQWANKAGTSEFALRPLFARSTIHEIEHSEWQLLYPFITYTRYGGEARWQLFQLISWTTGRPASDIERRESKTTIFPFLWLKRSDELKDQYAAIFPIHGTVKDRLAFREVNFTIFPLYMHTRKRFDVETIYAPWPFVQVPVGKGAHGFSLFPVAGHRRQEGLFQRDFALWPFFTYAHLGLNTDNPRQIWFTPLVFGAQRSKKFDYTSAPWPFATYIHDKANHYREFGLPWPFVAFGRGERRETTRIWPLFGYSKTTDTGDDPLAMFSFMNEDKEVKNVATGRQSRFFLWPLWSQKKLTVSGGERTRTKAVLFVFSDLREKVDGAPTVGRRVDFWPFFTWARDTDGNARFQAFSILAPLLPNNRGIASSYEPLWGLARWQRHADGDRALSLLWNTVRHESGPTRRNFSLVGGLFQYDRTLERTRVRFLWIPIVTKKTKGQSNVQLHR